MRDRMMKLDAQAATARNVLNTALHMRFGDDSSEPIKETGFLFGCCQVEEVETIMDQINVE